MTFSLGQLFLMLTVFAFAIALVQYIPSVAVAVWSVIGIVNCLIFDVLRVVSPNRTEHWLLKRLISSSIGSAAGAVIGIIGVVFLILIVWPEQHPIPLDGVVLAVKVMCIVGAGYGLAFPKLRSALLVIGRFLSG